MVHTQMHICEEHALKEVADGQRDIDKGKGEENKVSVPSSVK